MKSDKEKIIVRIAEIVHGGNLEADRDFYNLLGYYLKLKKSGNGELMIKLINGKLKIKGVTYIIPE